jgi:hypothetical protein
MTGAATRSVCNVARVTLLLPARQDPVVHVRQAQSIMISTRPPLACFALWVHLQALALLVPVAPAKPARSMRTSIQPLRAPPAQQALTCHQPLLVFAWTLSVTLVRLTLTFYRQRHANLARRGQKYLSVVRQVIAAGSIVLLAP